MLVSLASVSLGLAAFAAAAHCPSSQPPSHCVNVTAAEAPRGVQNGEYTINVDQYVQWPLTVSWAECSAKCDATPGCESFQYMLLPATAYSETSMNCNLFFRPIQDYKVDCSAKGASSADSYFDKGCAQPDLNKRGEVPAAPSNATAGTCNGGRPFRGDQFQFSRNSLRQGRLNSTQTQCRDLCRKTDDCKSYYWANMLGGNYIPANSSIGTPWKYNSEGYGPNQCLLMTQPVYEYTVGGFADLNSFWDINCPIAPVMPYPASS